MAKKAAPKPDPRAERLKTLYEGGPHPTQSDEVPDVPEWAEAFPLLNAFFTSPTMPDGSARKLPTITVWAEEGMLKAVLNDRQSARKLFAVGNSLATLAREMNEALTAKDPGWSSDAKGGRKRS